MSFNKYVKNKIIDYGKAKDDYKLLWYIDDVARMFEYIDGLVKDKKEDKTISKEDGDIIIARVQANRRRYLKLAEWIEEETKLDSTEFSRTYSYIYAQEQEIIETYSLITVMNLLGITADLDNMVLKEKALLSLYAVNDDALDEKQRKRKATAKAKEKVDVNIKKKDLSLTPEQVKAYDDAWNKEYQNNGGTNEGELNPAKRAMDAIEAKKQEEEAKRKAKEAEEDK